MKLTEYQSIRLNVGVTSQANFRWLQLEYLI